MTSIVLVVLWPPQPDRFPRTSFADFDGRKRDFFREKQPRIEANPKEIMEMHRANKRAGSRRRG